MISIKNLSRSYGRFDAVKNISLEVKKGQIFSFLGMNGAGKTTTIRMLVGILKPSSGSIKIGEYDIIKDIRKAKAITGYIPDRAQLYGKLTGRELLYFTSELYDINFKQANFKIDQLIEEYDLQEWENELIENYSHGLRQRLATCAALIHSPELLVIDEPMVGLDPQGAKTFKESLKKYAKQGTTIFLSTHSLPVAEEISDKIAIIKKGIIIAEGTIDELKSSAGEGTKDLEDAFLQIAISSAKLPQVELDFGDK